jgi:hypothetical protein
MMKTPEEKYACDSRYRHFVDLIESLIHKADFTPSELREMVIYACIRYEMYRIHREDVIVSREDAKRMSIEDTLSVMENFRKRNRRP